ncbi:MAG TPA: IclR family transcriptional regulator [Geobacteraceae bacterium]
MNRGKTSSLHSMGKALELIELIADGSCSHKVASLAGQVCMGQAKTARLLAMLTESGFIEHDKEHDAYLPGIKSIRLSQKILDNQNVIKVARPFMESLEKAHDEAVYVVFMKDTDVVFMDMVDTEQQVKAAPLVGQKFPFFTNAPGKVIMAFEPRDYLHKYLKKAFRKASPRELERFEQELSDIRTNRVAVDVGGLGEGITTIAVAITDYAGKVLGALALMGPSFRLLTERLDREIIPSLLGKARQLSEKFGYAGAW